MTGKPGCWWAVPLDCDFSETVKQNMSFCFPGTLYTLPSHSVYKVYILNLPSMHPVLKPSHFLIPFSFCCVFFNGFRPISSGLSVHFYRFSNPVEI